MGIMYGIGTIMELSNFVLNVVPMVGLALSIDFALMIVSRFREELERPSLGFAAGSSHGSTAAGSTLGPATGSSRGSTAAGSTLDPAAALNTTMKTAGRAVLFSAASVFLGLMAIMLIPLPIFTSIAAGAMTVLTVSVLLTFTLLPALLAFLWPAIQTANKPYSTLRAHRGRVTVPYVSNYQKTSFWYSMSLYMMKRPMRMIMLASLLLIGCFLPLSKMKLAIPDAASLPLGYESRQAYEVYQTHFVAPSTSDVFIIARGKTDDWNNNDSMRAYAFTQKLKDDPNVLQVDSAFSVLSGFSVPSVPSVPSVSTVPSIPSMSPMPSTDSEPMLQRFVKGNRMLLHVTIEGSPASGQAMDWVRRLEQEGASTELDLLLGGEAKYQQEVFDAIFQNIKLVFIFLFISNFMVLFVAFRSIMIPLKTMLMNLLSLGAAFGILAWIFEEGHLGMEPNSIAIMIPAFIFGLAFGISMDYGVFLVSRIFEVYEQTQDNDLAVLVGLTSTSRIITSAAAIMIAVTAPFAFGEVVGVKQLGIGIAAAIFIDATVIRLVLVPSLMKLLGRWNWWAPRWFES
jgi:RND superfamily putative drug exporter